MTWSLLIITLILIVFIILCPVVITAVISREIKEKELFNKIMISSATAGFVILIILLSFWITPIKNGDFTIESSSNENASSEMISLENAGFNKLSMEQYLALVKGTEKSIVLVARPTCGYCEKFAPILKQAKDDLKLTVNYVNTDEFSSEDWTKFTSSLDYLESEDWGTPLVLIVQNGTAVAVNNGYVDLNTIKQFFTNNGLGE